MTDSAFDLGRAVLDNSDLLPEPATAPAAAATSSPTLRRARPTPMRRPAAPAPSAPPLFKDKGLIRYHFGGAVFSLLGVVGFFLFLFYLNVRFSVQFLGTLQIGLLGALLIQGLVTLAENYMPKLKRFFFRAEMHELWKLARWAVWPLMGVCALFDVYSTAFGLRLEILNRFLRDAPPSESIAFASNPLLNTLWTFLGGLIALAPEPLLAVAVLGFFRLIRQRRRAVAVK